MHHLLLGLGSRPWGQKEINEILDLQNRIWIKDQANEAASRISERFGIFYKREPCFTRISHNLIIIIEKSLMTFF